MLRRNVATTFPALVTAAVIGCSVAQGAAAASSAPPTVPMGVTLVEVARELTLSQPDILWVRPGDAVGRTLLTSAADAPGVSKCVDACAREFVPFVAAKGAKAAGAWTVVKRADGARQWAYQGQPLYTWVKEEEAGEVAINVGLTEGSGAKLAERKIGAGNLLPPEGWQVARFKAETTLTTPSGIDAKLVGAAQAIVLTDHSGFTLYAFDGDARKDNQTCSDKGCQFEWLPVVAPDFARSVGDFTIVTRADGTSQWAYKKRPLYRYRGDLLPGDAFGGSADRKWKIAAVTESFRPAHVDVANIEAYGNTFTLKGMTLYTGALAQKRWGGRNTRDGFRNSWSKGFKLGGAACGSEKCLAEWHPFLAPRGAQASGFWQIYERPDGTRQWAYKGYAVWTHAGDKKPGDITGQLTYDYAKLGGTESDLKRTAFLDEVGGDRVFGGAGIYWVLTRP
jgi:predicted lipoprotein with Yx(FWY)xxD motif